MEPISPVQKRQEGQLVKDKELTYRTFTGWRGWGICGGSGVQEWVGWGSGGNGEQEGQEGTQFMGDGSKHERNGEEMGGEHYFWGMQGQGS